MNSGTVLVTIPVAESAVGILSVPILLSDGKVITVPSDDILAPPRLIVLPSKYKSFHLKEDVPKSYVVLEMCKYNLTILLYYTIFNYNPN